MLFLRDNAFLKLKIPLSVAAVRISPLQHTASRCCLSVMALMLSDRSGIVSQWPLEGADPGCLLAHHWVLRFICSTPGCLSFPEGNTHHTQTLWLTKGLSLSKKKKRKMKVDERVGGSRPHACDRLMFGIHSV